ncbi:MAG: acyltransferase [Flavobacteriales bacterium]|nr:acyltransferase [Flavobacteriales bacterium]
MSDKLYYLGDFDGSRKNNFTIVRIVLAWLVLYGHSFVIQKLEGFKDPLNAIFQGSTWVGAIAVDGFFAISGFLVCASIVNRGIVNYTISRVLRIFPGLIVCVLLSVFVMGPLLTSLSVTDYLADSKTFVYLKNMTLYYNVQWELPGVFQDSPNTAINGSLWSLPVEVRCYVLLAVVSLFGVFKHKNISNIIVGGLLVFGYYHFMDLPFVSLREKFSRPAMYFLIGVFFYVNRDKVLLDLRLAILSLVLVAFSFGQDWFLYVFPISIVYLIFFLIYRTTYISIDKKLGDISYGIYIYAWPVQQLVAVLLPDQTPVGNTIISSIIVFVLAYLSWNFIEKPSLFLKEKLLNISLFK